MFPSCHLPANKGPLLPGVETLSGGFTSLIRAVIRLNRDSPFLCLLVYTHFDSMECSDQSTMTQTDESSAASMTSQ